MILVIPIKHAFLTIEVKSYNPFFKIGIIYSYLPLNLKSDKCLIAKARIFGLGEYESFVNVFIAILAN
jgi:hypothetical protein